MTILQFDDEPDDDEEDDDDELDDDEDEDDEEGDEDEPETWQVRRASRHHVNLRRSLDFPFRSA